MPANRMNREEFFAKLAPLDEAGMKKALWNLYWRGSAQLRERIEGEIEPAEKARRQRAAAQPPDPALVLMDVGEFVALARSGAYLGGDRRVSPRDASGQMQRRPMAESARSESCAVPLRESGAESVRVALRGS